MFMLVTSRGKNIFEIVARSTVRNSTVIIIKGVVNFLHNRILLSQVHARARKHTDTHKLACKSSLVRIRCPLSWENIWPHILFFKIRASRSPAADHVCVCIYTLQYTNEYTYLCSDELHFKHFKLLGALAICFYYLFRKIPWIWGQKCQH